MTIRRLCIVGDSHVGAVKLGWDLISDENRSWEVDFFGAVGDSIGSLLIKGGELSPSVQSVRDSFALTSKGQNSIRTRNYDAFVIVSAGLGATVLTRRICATHSLASCYEPGSSPISRACLRDTVFNAIDSGAAMATARKLRSMTTAPVALLPTPLPSIEVLEADADKAIVFRASGMLAEIKHLYELSATRLEVNEGFAFISQPAETLDTPCYTRREFAAGGVNLTGRAKRDGDNFCHMNSNYGAIVMGLLLAHADSACRAVPSAAASAVNAALI